VIFKTEMASRGHKRSNLRWLSIWKWPLWYIQTMYQVSCFYQKVHKKVLRSSLWLLEIRDMAPKFRSSEVAALYTGVHGVHIGLYYCILAMYIGTCMHYVQEVYMSVHVHPCTLMYTSCTQCIHVPMYIANMQ